MTRDRLLALGALFLGGRCPGLSSLPPSTNEIAALGSMVAAGLLKLIDNGDTSWGDGVGNNVLFDPFGGIRPKAVVFTVTQQVFSGIPVIVNARSNAFG